MITLTERDILLANPIPSSISTFAAESQLADWKLRRERPTHIGYLMSEETITLPDQPPQIVVSPAWFGRLKKRIKELEKLPANWDSYDAVPVDPRIPSIAEDLLKWFAVDDMPPPDVFATNDGGLQIEWHIRRVNAAIEISLERTSIYFHDLDSGEPWSRPASDTDLRIVLRRLLTHV